MKKIFSIVLFFISGGNCFAQQITFQKMLGGTYNDYGWSVQQTTDGGYIIGGSVTSFGVNGDVYLIKTDSFGDTLWTRTFGGTNIDYGYTVQQTSDGGYIITGRRSGSAGSYPGTYLIKTDTIGNLIWTKMYAGIQNSECFSVQQTIDGGYIITGYTNSYFGVGNDVYLIKTDANGDSLWTKSFAGPGTETGFCVHQTIDGGYIITGNTSSFGAGGSDILLIKTDTLGNLLWAKTFGGAVSDWAYSVEQTTDGGYIIAGSTDNFGAGADDVYLIKTDANGDALWSKTFGGINDDNGWWVEQTTDGGYIITGTTGSFGAGMIDVYLVKTDPNGNLLWTKSFGGTDDDVAYSVQQTTDGGYAITGRTFSFAIGFDHVYFIKTDSLGNSGCNETSTTTIVTAPATQVTSPATIVTSPPTIVTTPATIAGSGGIVTALCTTVGISPTPALPAGEGVAITPNPTTNNFTITFPNTINKGFIEIYNVLGKKIFKENIFNISQKEIRLKPARPLAAGIYFVKVRDGEREYCEKLVIK
ncbi:MAG TPA: T9SS type A sorting domain-containing protein [Bacteroidia bacterium]|nr:T9SS type A sorting domain-containing protein [Bacteroidia bacterium]